MAVHTIQGRDPWWSSLAVNVLGGLFNDWQQREHNKKEAAYLGEIAKMYNDMQNGQNDTAPAPTTAPVQDTGQGLLNMNMAVPEGYNNNGWANAFHKTESPLLQFDLGTAGIAPALAGNAAPAVPTNAWANALGNSGNSLAEFDANTAGLVPLTATAPVQQAQAQGATRAPIVTPMDFYRAALELAGTKRFRMLNPDRVQAMLTPYMKLNEEARQEQLRNNLADDYMNATDGAGRIRTVTGGALRGIVPESMANTVFNQNKPIQFTVDAGGQIHFYNTDPMTGIPTNVGTVNRTLSPQEIAANALSWATFNEGQRQFDKTMGYNYANLQQQGALENRRLDIESNSAIGQVFTGNDGHQYIMRKDGRPIKVTDVPGLTDWQKETLKNNENILKSIRDERNRLRILKGQQINRGLETTDTDELLKELDRRERAILQQNDKIINSRNNSQQNKTEQATKTPLPPAGQNAPANGNNEIPLPPAVLPVAQTVNNAIQNYEQLVEQQKNVFAAADNEPVFRRKSDGKIYTGRMVRELMNRAKNGEFKNQGVTSDTEVPNWLLSRHGFELMPNIANTTQQTHVENNLDVLEANNTPVDTNTEAGIQNALEALNGQFGEQRWADWATAFNPQDFFNNNPMNTTPTINNSTLPIGSPNGLDSNMVLASNRRTRPQRVSLGRYSGDTKNGGQYSSIINRHAKANNVDPDLVAAIIQQESGGNSNSVSQAGAGGLMQLMPKTARGLGVTDVFDPEQNIAGGTKYIAQMLRRYKGNVEKALWAYNAGPGNADNGRLPDETKKYIPSVMARYRRLKGIAATTPNTPKRATRRRRRTRGRRIR